MRQFYETQADRDKEQVIAEKLERFWGVNLAKLPVSYGVDFAMLDKKDRKVTGWIEYKDRDASSKSYPDIMLSLLKVSSGLKLADLTHCPFFFVVSFTDKTMIHQIKQVTDYPLQHKGRTVKTRDAGDIEPVIFIPMAWFTELNLS